MAAEPLSKAAAARHQRAVDRAERALRHLDAAGEQITFQSVARQAGVSRQWLYTQPAIRREIEQLRERAPTQAVGVPARQRTTEARCVNASRRCAPRTTVCARRTPASRPNSPSPMDSSDRPTAVILSTDDGSS